jgi:hypothetical protein
MIKSKHLLLAGAVGFSTMLFAAGDEEQLAKDSQNYLKKWDNVSKSVQISYDANGNKIQTYQEQRVATQNAFIEHEGLRAFEIDEDGITFTTTNNRGRRTNQRITVVQWNQLTDADRQALREALVTGAPLLRETQTVQITEVVEIDENENTSSDEIRTTTPGETTPLENNRVQFIWPLLTMNQQMPLLQYAYQNNVISEDEFLILFKRFLNYMVLQSQRRQVVGHDGDDDKQKARIEGFFACVAAMIIPELLAEILDDKVVANDLNQNSKFLSPRVALRSYFHIHNIDEIIPTSVPNNPEGESTDEEEKKDEEPEDPVVEQVAAIVEQITQPVDEEPVDEEFRGEATHYIYNALRIGLGAAVAGAGIFVANQNDMLPDLGGCNPL